MYSINSQLDSYLALVCTVNGFSYEPGSMIVMSHASVFKSVLVNRSMVCSCVVCGCPSKSNQNLSLYPMVSTTNVSPSHRPVECPYQVGSGSFGCGRPSIKICR